MHIVFISTSDDPHEWATLLQPHVPGLKLHPWPTIPDPALIEAALVWRPPAGVLNQFPHLKLIQNLGMGVDYLFEDPHLPAVPVARLVDDTLIGQMSEYVALETLRFHRRSADYEQFQQERRWRPLPAPDTRRCTVGILGLGAIGLDTARKLSALGFPVIGWSRSPKTVAGVECLHGAAALPAFLARCRVLVCLLPLTAETENIINAATLAQLPPGAYLINCARGRHVVEADLLAALDSGHLAGATLDVFRTEPLPVEHPFWTHPKIRITPHSAGLTTAWSAAAQVAENLRRVQAGVPPLNQIDRTRGY